MTEIRIFPRSTNDLDTVVGEFIREYLLWKIAEIPAEEVAKRRGYNALRISTGVDPQRLRRLCTALEIDPNERKSC